MLAYNLSKLFIVIIIHMDLYVPIINSNAFQLELAPENSELLQVPYAPVQSSFECA